MRLGISHHLGLTSDPEEWLKVVKHLGCRAMTFPLDYTADNKLIDDYATIAKENDIVIAEVGAWSNIMSPNQEIKNDAVNFCKHQLELAERVGARCCVNITGGKGEIWDGSYKGNYALETFNEAVDTINDIINSVAPKNTFYAIESMPNMIPWDPDNYLELMNAVDNKRLCAHMDIFNWINTPRKYFFNEELMDHAFEVLHGKIKSVHIKNNMIDHELTMCIRECPLPEGGINLEHYAELATKEDPEMPVLIEHQHDYDMYISAWKYLDERLKSWER